MRFSRKHWPVLVAISLFLLLGFPLEDYDLARTGAQEGDATMEVEYLGSVPSGSSLTDLVSEENKQIIRLKERWLDSRANLGKLHTLRVSENGKYKVLGSASTSKDMIRATFVDSNGAEIWGAEVGDLVYVSNNGRNIAAARSFSGMVDFYDVRASSGPVTTTQVDGESAFSYDGEYFISAGPKLILRRSDGTLVWGKDTGTEAYKKVAISADGSSIVMASSGEPEPTLTDVVESQVVQEELRRSPGKLVGEELREAVAEERARLWREAQEKQSAQGTEGVKSSQQASSPWWKKKVYLSFLRRDGTLTNQTSVKLRQAQSLVISDDGHYAALSCDSTLLFYETESESLLWRKTFPTVYWWMKDVALSSDGSVIALGVRPDRGDPSSPPCLYLLSKEGSEIGQFQLQHSLQSPEAHWGPVVAFTEDGRFILTATYAQKHLFKITAGRR